MLEHLPRRLLHLEGLAVLIGALVLYFHASYGWLLLLVLFLAPDLSAIGYVAGPRVGALTYDVVHTYALPIALAAMKQIHPDTPARAFEVPDDAVLVRDRKTGELIPYMRGHVPDDLLSGVRFESGEDKDATVLNGH